MQLVTGTRPPAIGWRALDVVLTAAILAALAATTAAQQQFDELRKRGLPPDRWDTQSVAMGDLDGDGDLDLVCANGSEASWKYWYVFGQQNQLFLGDGHNGSFTEATGTRMPVDQDYSRAVALGDLDNDGDLDIVFGNVYAKLKLYLNDGTGVFSDGPSRVPTVFDATAVALDDVDGDGDLDIVCGTNRLFTYTPQDRLLLNDGTGVFRDVTATHLPPGYYATADIAFGDVDGDGDLDLLLATTLYPKRSSRLYLNDGTGIFTDATAARLPSVPESVLSVALGDVDGDGDLDLVWGITRWGNPTPQNRLLLNDGSGRFADATAAQMPVDTDDTTALVLADLDGDSDLDLVLGNDWQPNRLYRNDGTGTFASATSGWLPTRYFTPSIALGDIDLDGDLDVLFGNSGVQFDPAPPNELYLNDGTGTFDDAEPSGLPEDVDGGRDVALADVDSDGDLDLVVANAYGPQGQQNRLYLNDGIGAYGDATAAHLPARQDYSAAIALGDVDADGDLDLVFGNFYSPPYVGEQNRLYLNNGSGIFTDVTAAQLPFDNDGTEDLALGDVDGDGDLDLALANSNGQDRLYLNDGSGTFVDVTAAHMPQDADFTNAVVFGDVDGDGDLDLVFGGSLWRTTSRLYLNDGSGRFADVTGTHIGPRSSSTSGTLGLILVDIDGDSDLDLVEANCSQNALYLNDGTGKFTDATATHMPVDWSCGRAVAAGDVDLDGDLDLVFGNARDVFLQDSLYLNDGTGRFADVTAARMLKNNTDTSAIALGDVDDDGDLDLVFANFGEPNELQLNLLRQLDTPHPLRAGRTYTLDAYARCGPFRPADLALPFAATGRAAVPVPPLGIVGLDPTQTVALPPFLVPHPAGVASISLPVPNLPSLVGTTLSAQAVLVPFPYPARLTGVVSDVLTR